MLRIRTLVKQGVCILSCSGELTLGGGELQLREALQAALERGERKIVLDYRDLRYMDSAGVGETVACAKHAFERLAVIKVLVPEAGSIARVFEVSGLDRAYEVFTEESLAVSSFWR